MFTTQTSRKLLIKCHSLNTQSVPSPPHSYPHSFPALATPRPKPGKPPPQSWICAAASFLRHVTSRPPPPRCYREAASSRIRVDVSYPERRRSASSSPTLRSPEAADLYAPAFAFDCSQSPPTIHTPCLRLGGHCCHFPPIDVVASSSQHPSPTSVPNGVRPLSHPS